jgi:hypothetical protein
MAVKKVTQTENKMPSIIKKVPFKLTKGYAFLESEVVFIFLFLLVMFVKPEFVETMGPVIIQAMQWLAIAFMGLNVADNGVKGKYYQPDLADKEYRCVD